MDPVSLLVGAGIAALFTLVGRFTRRADRTKTGEPRPVCGCGHELAFHDPKTSECHGLVDGDPVGYEAHGYPTAYKKVRCSCRQYVGPVPADQLLASFQSPTLPPQ